MMFSQPPCKDCVNRYLGCHSDCPTWQVWKSDENSKNAELRFNKSVMAGLVECSTASFNRHGVKGIKAW